MNPLVVDLETEWRGGQNQALLLLKGLNEQGHAADLLAARGSALAHRARRAGIRVRTVSRGVFRVPAAAKIFSLLRNEGYDLVHANEAHAVTAAWLSGAHRRVPLVISRRVGYPLGRSFIAQARYQAAARILANSQWVAEQAAASGAPRDKLRVVYEGAEIPPLVTPRERAEARLRWGISGDTPLLGCVGVLLPDKGQEWLIRALAELRRTIPGAKLLLAGDGPCRQALQELAAGLHLSDAVIFAGFVKEVESVYAALDLFLLPSFFEALNNSLLAAMAHAVPSIAFRRGALPEIIEDGRSGLIVSGPDVPEISAAAARILSDPQFARTLGENARARVAERFSAERMVEETLKAYGELVY